MRDRLYQSLLKSLQQWHTRSLPRETLPVKPGQPARHVAVQEAVELAQNELRWMVEDAKPHLPYGTHRQWRHNLGKAVSEMVRRRTVHHEPLAYILGSQPFGPLNISVHPPLLIPRPETEEWTLKIDAMIRDNIAKLKHGGWDAEQTEPEPFRVLDLCCGTGCIGLTVARSLSMAHVKSNIILMDKNPSALECVQMNMCKNHVRSTPHTRITTVHQDILNTPHKDLLDHFARLTDSKGFDLILCNPPYLLTADWEQLDASVKNWEDRDALCGDDPQDHAVTDGCAFYRRISELVNDVKAPVPLYRQRAVHPFRQGLPAIIFEVGKDQHDQVKNILSSGALFGSAEIRIWEDAFGVKRAVAGYLSPSSHQQ